MDGFLDPSKYNLQEKKMADGKELKGFNDTKPAGTNSIDAKYAPNPKSAFPASDVSNQSSAQGPK